MEVSGTNTHLNRKYLHGGSGVERQLRSARDCSLNHGLLIPNGQIWFLLTESVASFQSLAMTVLLKPNWKHKKCCK